jgi:hypothetical protein
MGGHPERTHECLIYSNSAHESGYGKLLIHTWHIGEASMEMEVAAALNRKDVAHVEVIDVKNHRRCIRVRNSAPIPI